MVAVMIRTNKLLLRWRRKTMSRNTHENAYTPQEKVNIADEFSPALTEVLETVAPVWGNKVIVEPSHQKEVSPSTFLKLRQLGDRGLRQVMQLLTNND
jgi:hypothetical protein